MNEYGVLIAERTQFRCTTLAWRWFNELPAKTTATQTSLRLTYQFLSRQQSIEYSSIQLAQILRLKIAQTFTSRQPSGGQFGTILGFIFETWKKIKTDGSDHHLPLEIFNRAISAGTPSYLPWTR
jgi:hypothetical protein